MAPRRPGIAEVATDIVLAALRDSEGMISITDMTDQVHAAILAVLEQKTARQNRYTVRYGRARKRT